LSETSSGDLDEAVADADTYWSNFYTTYRDARHRAPSQFASFALGVALEFGVEQVLDFGCGNGRDARFFSLYGLRAHGVDRVPEAVESAQRLVGVEDDPRGAVPTYSQSTSLSIDDALDAGRFRRDLPTMVYARFLLHAMSLEDATEFLRSLNSQRYKVLLFAAEFRTNGDLSRTKEMPSHYRRETDLDNVTSALASSGFRIHFTTTGTGYAVWGREDALVSRVIAIRA
jgi:SAM-dependent methyltransferase